MFASGDFPHAREFASGLAPRAPPRQAHRRSRGRIHRSARSDRAAGRRFRRCALAHRLAASAAAQPPLRALHHDDARTARSAWVVGCGPPIFRRPFRLDIRQSTSAPGQANWRGTVHHGLPGDLFRPSYGQGCYLAFLGRLTAEKGPESAIRIARAAVMQLRIGQAASRRKALLQGTARTANRRHADQAHRRSE